MHRFTKTHFDLFLPISVRSFRRQRVLIARSLPSIFPRPLKHESNYNAVIPRRWQERFWGTGRIWPEPRGKGLFLPSQGSPVNCRNGLIVSSRELKGFCPSTQHCREETSIARRQRVRVAAARLPTRLVSLIDAVTAVPDPRATRFTRFYHDLPKDLIVPVSFLSERSISRCVIF